MKIPFVMKKCSKCNNWLVANTKNFHRNKKEMYGIRHQCKECCRIYQVLHKYNITKEQYKELIEFFNNKCCYTGERLSNDIMTIDHIKALNNKGQNVIWNMVPATRSSNSSKGIHNMAEWYKEQYFYDKDRLYKIYSWQLYALDKWGE